MPRYQQPSRFYRIIQVFCVASIVVGITWGWQQLKDPERFPIATVKVQANYTHISQKELTNILTPHVNEGFFGLDKKALTTALLEVSPWIASVIISKTWPDVLTVTIIEHVATAQWEDKGLVNAEGNIFYAAPNTFPANLPLLVGNETHIPELWKDYQQMQVILKPIRMQITEISLSDRQAITLLLNNGTKIIAGRKDPLLRLQRFVKVYPKMLKPGNAAETIDLRYEHGLSIKWPENQGV